MGPWTGNERVQLSTMRHLRNIIAIGTVLGALAAAPFAHAATQYHVLGHGWGHGIGMSQYGAKGFAERGTSHTDIIKHYYSGSTVSDSNGVPAAARTLDVLLQDGMANAAFQVDGSGVTVTRGSTKKTTANGDIITAKVESGNVAIYRKRGSDTTRLFAAGTSAVRISGGDGKIQTRFTADNGFYGHHYRGSISLRDAGSSIMVLNTVGMESYLRSVVPDEMPQSWHAQALRAQAIAARSYAVATRKTGTYDAFCDTRSQMYGGIEHEEGASDSAVTGTSGKVARHSGAVIPTFFHSTSGGRTAAIEDVWGSAPRPYLKSVSDPYEKSPRSNWTVKYSATAFERKWGGVPGSLRSVAVSLNASKRASRVSANGSGGSESISGPGFQQRFGLWSTYFRIEKLALNANKYTVARGGSVKLTGVSPRSGTTKLFYRNSGASTWVDAGALTISSTGTFARTVKVSNARTYMIKRGSRTGPAINIRLS